VRRARRVADHAAQGDAHALQRHHQRHQVVTLLRPLRVAEPRRQRRPCGARAGHVVRLLAVAGQRHPGEGALHRRRILEQRMDGDRAGAKRHHGGFELRSRGADLHPRSGAVGDEELDEAEPIEQRVQRPRVRGPVAQLLERDRQRSRRIEPRARELARHLLAPGAQRLAERARHVVCGAQGGLDAAMGLDERACALGADALHPGQLVVVTDQRQPLRHRCGRDGEALVHDLRRVADVLVRVVPPGRIVDELREALVDAGDDDVVAGGTRGARVAGHQVQLVGRLDHVQPERAEQLGQRRQLRRQRRRPTGRGRLGADDGHRARRCLRGHGAVDGARHGEEAVHRLAVFADPIGGHHQVTARQQVGRRSDEGPLRHGESAGEPGGAAQRASASTA
jgi:hypothetical protein